MPHFLLIQHPLDYSAPLEYPRGLGVNRNNRALYIRPVGLQVWPDELADILPTIIIDNHPVPLGEVRARFCDIRQVGATSTLLTNYLRHAAVELDGATATALTIDILSNTQSFTKGATLLDMEALEHLLLQANTDLLRRLYSRQTTERETDTS